ncbi:MAG: hypothetical protein GEU79_08225 [Acidimicrobiia bacterium]|nr:hypothetical protein [Acidimicrobiia bacterium]
MNDETRILPPEDRPQLTPEPSGSDRRARKKGRKRGRSTGQKWVIRLLILAIVLVAGVIGVGLLADFRMGEAGELTSLAEGSGTYLIVGTDSRENLPEDVEGNFGDFEGARADVIMLMQARGDYRQLLSIPRDLKVEIPDNGTNKVNAAYAFGGPDLLVQTVSQETGIDINHYIEVDFASFAGIVDSVGGIELDLEYPARDAKSGLDLEAGRQTVNGSDALAYARSRSYEELIDGEWVSSGGGDIDRTGRQREVLLQLISKATSPSGLIRSPGVLAEVTGQMKVDSTVSPLTLFQTALGFRVAGTTQAVSLPVVNSNEGGVAYVVREEPAATDVINAFASGESLETAAESVE